MSNYAISTIHFVVGPDKADAQSRYDRGVKISTHGPQSTLYTLPDVKAGVDAVTADNATLKSAMDAYSKARQTYLKARTALGTAVLGFDLSYGVLVTTAEKRCTTADDGASLGLEPRGATSNPFGMPVAVLMTQNIPLDYVRIHVKRAKGIRAVSVQVSPDPTNPALWKELDGDGAVHLIHNPSPGILWARAASRSAHAISDYTIPVSILVK
jgi:hypothetical protein